MRTESCAAEPKKDFVENKAQVVITHIQNRILCRELKVGDRIPPEGELCAMLNVSRTTVREAMKQLEAIGIVTVRRGDGTYVAEPVNIFYKSPIIFRLLLSNMTWDEIFQFREVMEFSVIRCAIQNGVTEEDIESLRTTNHNIFKLQKSGGSLREYYSADHSFHQKMAEIARNRMLSDIYDILFDLTEPLIQNTYSEGLNPALDSHEAVILALEKRDLFLAMNAAVLTANYIREASTEKSSEPFAISPNKLQYIAEFCTNSLTF